MKKNNLDSNKENNFSSLKMHQEINEVYCIAVSS
jgi:hypothetical protein